MNTITINGAKVDLILDQTENGHSYMRVQGQQCQSCGSAVAYFGNRLWCMGGCSELEESEVVREEAEASA